MGQCPQGVLTSCSGEWDLVAMVLGETSPLAVFRRNKSERRLHLGPWPAGSAESSRTDAGPTLVAKETVPATQSSLPFSPRQVHVEQHRVISCFLFLEVPWAPLCSIP